MYGIMISNVLWISTQKEYFEEQYYKLFKVSRFHLDNISNALKKYLIHEMTTFQVLLFSSIWHIYCTFNTFQGCIKCYLNVWQSY